MLVKSVKSSTLLCKCGHSHAMVNTPTSKHRAVSSRTTHSVSLHLTNVFKCLRIPFKSQGFYLARLGPTSPDKARTGSDSWMSAWFE